MEGTISSRERKAPKESDKRAAELARVQGQNGIRELRGKIPSLGGSSSTP